MKEYKALQDLVIASLMSRAYIFTKVGEPINELYVPFSYDKRYFLADYLREHDLLPFVKVDIDSNEMIIKLDFKLRSVVDTWFNRNEKIFKKDFLKSSDLSTVLLCINLFGTRQIEGVAFLTNVNQKYLFTLCYTLTEKLKVKTIFSKNQIKIPDVPKLFLESIQQTSSKNCLFIASYLDKKEKEELIKAASSVKNKLGYDYLCVQS